MRALTTILFATTTLLSGVAATAMAAEPVQQQPTYQQMSDMEGTYALSDGRRARLYVLDGSLHLQIGRQHAQLEQDSKGRWVTHSRSITLQFQPDRDSNRIVLNYGNPADAPPIRLAAREAHGRGAVD